MIKTIKQAKALAKDYNKIKKDIKRLEFLKQHNNELKVILDNDSSQVGFILDEDMDEDLQELILEIDLESFEEYHGWGDGVVILMKFAGITAEPC